MDSDSVGHEADSRAVGGKARFPTNAYEADSKRHFTGQELAGSEGLMKSELHGSEGRRGGKTELPGAHVAGVYRPEDRRELFGSDGANEMEGSHVYMELAGSPVPEYYGNSAAVQMNPLSPRSGATTPANETSHRSPLLSPTSAASPVSRPSSGRGRGSTSAASPLSPESHRGSESHRSPVSPGSEGRNVSRDVSNAGDGRGRERGRSSRTHSVSPSGFEGGPLRDYEDYGDVSRENSRTRDWPGSVR